MRACKNPPPFTFANVKKALQPGRVYSAQAISLKFGVPVDAVQTMMLGAIMLGSVRQRPSRRGFRAGYWIPESGFASIAGRRTGPLASGTGLTGYMAELWRLHDACMAARGQPELMRFARPYPVAR